MRQQATARGRGDEGARPPSSDAGAALNGRDICGSAEKRPGTRGESLCPRGALSRFPSLVGDSLTAGARLPAAFPWGPVVPASAVTRQARPPTTASDGSPPPQGAPARARAAAASPARACRWLTLGSVVVATTSRARLALTCCVRSRLAHRQLIPRAVKDALLARGNLRWARGAGRGWRWRDSDELRCGWVR